MSRWWLVFTALVAGCPEAPYACDLMAVSSVQVEVLDEAGNPMANATLRFVVDGGSPQPCELFQPGSYVCGWEHEGNFEITIEAPGYETETRSAVVESDECHVIGESLTVNMVLACDDPPPAVILTVLDPDGSPAEGEAVAWAPMGTDGIPTACEAQTDGTWACAYGATGDLDVYVTPHATDPYAPVLEVVSVPEGACGPETQSRTVTFAYLPD
jgi:hypothetical protein